ncbi:unnamed protein product [Scytosiphon promiscuus]
MCWCWTPLLWQTTTCSEWPVLSLALYFLLFEESKPVLGFVLRVQRQGFVHTNNLRTAVHDLTSIRVRLALITPGIGRALPSRLFLSPPCAPPLLVSVYDSRVCFVIPTHCYQRRLAVPL